MKALEFINQLRQQGRYSFTISEAEAALGNSKIATINALKRLKSNIVSPARGFYLITPPEYQMLGCLPADMFIAQLMRYYQLPYYIGYLSAAQYYGAAHQKPQRFQVVTLKNRRPIQCGRTHIEFIANKALQQYPTRSFNSATGNIIVASPETLAIDLVTAPQHAAGIDNIATILVELAESIRPNVLTEMANKSDTVFWIQRLGYLFDFLEQASLSTLLWNTIKEKKIHWVKLIPQTGYQAIDRNAKWKIIVNTEVEPDL